MFKDAISTQITITLPKKVGDEPQLTIRRMVQLVIADHTYIDRETAVDQIAYHLKLSNIPFKTVALLESTIRIRPQ